ncbi:MAG TPA: SDR family NAD(P)-dependent oxidoreductase [Ktedonobacterales bacterium]
MIRFDGQVVLVTGAGRGLGRAYAHVLASLGAQVVVHDAGVARDGTGRDPSVADAVVREIQEAGGQAVAAYEDLSSREACEALIARTWERFGRLDALVNNAGLVRYTSLEATDAPGWESLLRVNVEAPFWLCRAAMPLMRQQGGGRIVLTVSGHGLYNTGATDLTAYSVTKAAQFGLMNALAAEGAPASIRVNAISPVAATRIYRATVAPDAFRPEQVAPGVAYLASAACGHSGVVLRAANGTFSVGRYIVTGGVNFGLQPVTPDAIAERWEEITSGLHEPD